MAIAMRKRILSNSLQGIKTALIVGTLLLVINQYDAIFGSSELRWFSAVLTYCVPFAVFMFGKYSSAKN